MNNLMDDPIWPGKINPDRAARIDCSKLAGTQEEDA
jgi:hypothetical protein